jgi:hypothetical protein
MEYIFRLVQYQTALQTSNDRLQIFYDQLTNQLKNKQRIALILIENDKRINQLKMYLSNLGVSKINYYTFLILT